MCTLGRAQSLPKSRCGDQSAELFKFGFARAISLLIFSKSSKLKHLENENDRKSRAEKDDREEKNARREREQLQVRPQETWRGIPRGRQSLLIPLLSPP
jgi:hypothetical protein